MANRDLVWYNFDMLFGGFSVAGLLANAIALLVAIDVHEFCHAWMAYQLGDRTARDKGRLTLNPIAHLDPMGTLMLLVARFGWGKPVPVNPYNLRNGPRKGMMIVSFAGPLANLLTAWLFALPFRTRLLDISLSGGFIPSLSMILATIVLVNIILAVFNLIPVAPLDGFSVAMGLVPRRWAYTLAQLEPYGPLILVLLIASGFLGFDVLGAIMGPVIWFFLRLFAG